MAKIVATNALVNSIAQDVQAGRFAPGMWLKQIDLQVRYGKSRSDVRRALESVPAEAAASAEGALKALIEGIELTERDLLKTLERHGIRRIEPKGERFDPNLHQAMFEVPDPSVPNGTVRDVVQSGFVIGDRVLRPALVGVAKGGPKPAESGAGTDRTA